MSPAQRPEAACARPSSSSACQLRQPAGACCSTTHVLGVVAVDDGRHAAGDQPRREAQRGGLGVGAPRGGDPLVGHSQPRQRLLDDQRDARPAHRQHGARDASRQLLDGQLERRAARRRARRGSRRRVAAVERHDGGSAGVQSARSPARAGGVDRELGDLPAALQRLGAIGAHVRHTCRSRSKCTRVATACATAASSQGSTSASTTVTSLTRLTASRAASAAVRALAGLVRAERDDRRQPPGAALGHRDGAHRRHEGAQPPLEPGGDRDAAEQRVLGVEARAGRPDRGRRAGA